ncbi:MAG: tRNA lysidine(34) synthetase TilS [Lachnospiraceae bacterium]|nr:tRNA lysidine(34) synthetase TilS [Lachnospiraceae bacterium]
MANKITEDIYFKVKKYIEQQQMIMGGDVILAGVSGGADSVCLLYMLSELSKELGFDLVTVHVHHGLREDADKDAAYVEELCNKLGVPFYLRQVDMLGYAKEMGLSSEEAGRRLRYQAFEDVLKEVHETNKVKVRDRTAYKIAVAHNKNDKAETMLFNLFRGSGLKGLGSIRSVRDNIIRPILCLGRAEIETWLEQRNIAFCIDSTNEDDTYTRNKIRHHILPFAEEQISKNSVAHISDAADVLAETEDYIRKQTLLAYERCTYELQEKSVQIEDDENDGLTLDLNIFRQEEPFLQKMILLHCMEMLTPHRKDITKEHIAALMEISSKGGSKELFLPYGLTAYKQYDTLVILKKAEKSNGLTQISETCPQRSVLVPGETEVPGLGTLEFKYLEKNEFFYKKDQIIPQKTYTKWFDCDKITGVLVLRTRKTGDYLTIDSTLRKKSVKEYMINEKIPKMQRDSIYLLADGPHILWVPGYRISQYYKVDESTKRILQVRLKENDNG